MVSMTETNIVLHENTIYAYSILQGMFSSFICQDNL